MRGAYRFLLAAATGLLPRVAGGQAQPPPPRESPKAPLPSIPKDQRPPPGMCRIWVDNVPAARQPAPTDCATAVRNRPPNARVIFPDDKALPKGPVKSLAPGKGDPKTKPDTTRRRKPPAEPAPA